MTAITAELTSDGRAIAVIGSELFDDEVAYIARQIRGITPLITPSDPRGALIVPLTWASVVQLSTVVPKGWHPGPRLQRWVTGELAKRARMEPDGTNTSRVLPEGLVPRPYQWTGAGLIAATGRALISDEPGTGKTITAILGLLARQEHGGDALPVLVVCPASVVDAWVDAWRTWVPDYTAVAYRGTGRKLLLSQAHADVYVASYDTARIDVAYLADRLAPSALVIDEHHMIKNHRAARTVAVRRVARGADVVVALSGTPITHHPGDLYPTLACLEPDAWPSRERWVRRYCLVDAGDYGETILGLNPGREDELRLCLLGQHRRVAKADVLSQLPPKIYSVRYVDLPVAHRRTYDQMAKRMLAELPDGTELSVMTVLAQMTRLSQLASAPADVTTTIEVAEDGEETEHVEVTLKGPSWKVDALLEILAERPSQQVVVFAPSKQLIEIAQQAVHDAGYTTGLIVGGQYARTRTLMINEFQAGNVDVMFVTTGAGGTGITLTAASTVAFLQRPWSLVESLQAEDRCHRIGSERHDSIEIIDIVARDTIDSRVRDALRTKGQQLADLVQDPRIIADLLGGTKTARKAA